MIGGRRVGAVLPAAGSARRMGSSVPKQFLSVAGHPLMAYALDALQRSPVVDEIVIPAPGNELRRVERIVGRYRFTKVVGVVPGGKRRQDSVLNGLRALEGRSLQIVLVHDAARPFLTAGLIASVAGAAARYGAAIAAVRPHDTVRMSAPGRSAGATLPREHLWMVQTPQGFRFRLLFEALQRAVRERFTGTDDAVFVERTGRRVRVVEGSPVNIKVTTPADVLLAETLIRARSGGLRGTRSRAPLIFR